MEECLEIGGLYSEYNVSSIIVVSCLAGAEDVDAQTSPAQGQQAFSALFNANPCKLLNLLVDHGYFTLNFEAYGVDSCSLILIFDL